MFTSVCSVCLWRSVRLSSCFYRAGGGRVGRPSEHETLLCSPIVNDIVSTVHRSYLITLITKAIDTTSISYQPLWLCCWRGDISSFLFTKNRDHSSLY